MGVNQTIPYFGIKAGAGLDNPNFVITSGGNVGIGTTTPSTLLHLVNSSGPTIRLVRTSNRFDISADNDFMELNARDASTYMIFKTADTERMRITSGGQVGIGFSAISYKLQVAGEITTHAGANTSYYAYMNYLGTTYNFGSGENTDNVDFKIAGGTTWTTGGNFRFWTQTGASSPVERMRITPSGNVLIGTTTDNGYKLRVNGDIYVDGVYRVPVSSYFICGSAGYRFNNTTDAFNNFIALDNGNATLRGTLTQNASDERLKNNIEIIPNAIDKIKQLRGVTFKWNQELYETSRTFDIGVIAQEVEKVLPNAVCLAPFDTNFDDNTSKSGQNYLTVYYEKLIPLLIEGIKELKAELDELKSKN